eukprot:15361668-Ditylum_brightwellii.AAC.1
MKPVVSGHGFLDVKSLNLYPKDGPKDDDNNLMGETAGIFLGMNMTIDRFLKGHPEVTGDGIKYTWVNATFYLRTSSLAERRIVEQFKEQ